MSVRPRQCGPKLSNSSLSWRPPLTPHALERRYSLAALAEARHEHELVPDARVHVHLDVAHMGLGGDDSWSPSVREVCSAPTTPCTHGPQKGSLLVTAKAGPRGTVVACTCTQRNETIWSVPPSALWPAGVFGAAGDLQLQLFSDADPCWQARSVVCCRSCAWALAAVISVRAQLTADWRRRQHSHICTMARTSHVLHCGESQSYAVVAVPNKCTVRNQHRAM